MNISKFGHFELCTLLKSWIWALQICGIRFFIPCSNLVPNLEQVEILLEFSFFSSFSLGKSEQLIRKVWNIGEEVNNCLCSLLDCYQIKKEIILTGIKWTFAVCKKVILCYTIFAAKFNLILFFLNCNIFLSTNISFLVLVQTKCEILQL